MPIASCSLSLIRLGPVDASHQPIRTSPAAHIQTLSYKEALPRYSPPTRANLPSHAKLKYTHTYLGQMSYNNAFSPYPLTRHKLTRVKYLAWETRALASARLGSTAARKEITPAQTPLWFVTWLQA
ncbi:hypothetical protein ACGC1H_005932 [Rhizoctonia solani]